MKLIFILTLATIVNCLSENYDLDPVTRTSRVKRIDNQPLQETAGDNTTIKNEENHELLKYRGGRQYDFQDEEYYDNNDDYYDDYESYKDEYYRRSEEEDSALEKFKKLVQDKPDVVLSVKLYNISYCVSDGRKRSRKRPVGRFSEFDKLLTSIFPKIFSSGQKRINMYYIVFSAEGQGLFDAKGQHTFTYKSQRKRKVINERTNLITTVKNAILDVQGKMKLRLQFLLGDKQNAIRDRDGSNTIFFDPELRIKYNRFMYSVLGIACPGELSLKKTKMIMHQFAKLMSTPKDVEKFIEAHNELPDYKIKTQEMSTGTMDNDIFDMFKPYIKEKNMDTVQIGLSDAAEALYHQATKSGDVLKPDAGFDNAQDTAGPAMKNHFNQAMDMLRDKAARISEGDDIGKIRNSIMEYLHRLFQEHRRFTGNSRKFYEIKNHFGVFKGTTKEKFLDN